MSLLPPTPGTAWGQITGDLNDQTDLIAAIAAGDAAAVAAALASAQAYLHDKTRITATNTSGATKAAGVWHLFSLDPNNSSSTTYAILGQWVSDTAPGASGQLTVLGKVYGTKVSSTAIPVGTPLIYDGDLQKFVPYTGFNLDCTVFAAATAPAGSNSLTVMLNATPGRVWTGALPS